MTLHEAVQADGSAADVANAAYELLIGAKDGADLTEWLAMGGIPQTMTCGEAETLAHILRHVGQTKAADYIIETHRETDEPGDLHYQGAEA